MSDFANPEPPAAVRWIPSDGSMSPVAAREVEQDEAEHDLVMDQIRAEANELAAVEAHRKILRAAEQDEARARAFQQRVIGWAYVLLVGLLAVVFWILVQVAVEL